jgi:hypothetical protein
LINFAAKRPYYGISIGFRGCFAVVDWPIDRAKI